MTSARSAIRWMPAKMPGERLHILVLGVGGNVSQSILKALALSSIRCRVIGACISPLSFGLFTVDKAYISPTASDAAFLEWLLGVCRAERVDAILSGVEPVLEVLSREAARILAETGAVCVVSPPASLAVGADKFDTCRWLQDQGCPYPRYARADDAESLQALVRDCGYPLIAKPRCGKGSEGVLRVNTDAELQLIRGRTDFVVQEYLGDPSHEYTAGCFSDSESRVRGAIVLRRDLLQGTTYRAEAGEFPAVRNAAVQLAEKLRPLGPCNFQMRVHRGSAVCFEINVRFSGTTALRARMGFNDVEATLRHFVLGQPAVDLPVITRGIALRYWNEAYVDPRAVAELSRNSQLDEPRRYPAIIEDYGIRP